MRLPEAERLRADRPSLRRARCEPCRWPLPHRHAAAPSRPAPCRVGTRRRGRRPARRWRRRAGA
eukprot:4107590-Prymnesium_polylepis.1